MSNGMKHPYYDVAQAASMLGIEKDLLITALKNGMLPSSYAKQKGTYWRVSAKDIKAFRDTREGLREALGLQEFEKGYTQ